LYWEHTGNAAVRRGRWKLVRAHPGAKRYWVDSGDASVRPRPAYDTSYAWELYDLSSDRSETDNLADRHPEVVKDLSEQWNAWAARVGVKPFDVILDGYTRRGQSYKDAIE
jgi:arylsulfatase